MTLVEIMIVITIVGAAMGGVVLSFRAIGRTQARGSATRLGAGIRYLYDQAIVTGKYYRLTVNLDDGSYKAERSDERFFLASDKEVAPGGGKAFDADEETRRLDEEEAREKERSSSLARQLQPPPVPKRAHFQSFTDAMLPTVTMSGGYIRDLYTPRQREPYTEGKAYLYFFPDGHTERAVIHLGTDKEDEESQYTLLVQALTGRVEIKPGRVPPPHRRPRRRRLPHVPEQISR